MTIDEPSIDAHTRDDRLMPMIPDHRKFITSFDPATGLHIATTLADDKEAIELKIQKSVAAQKEWKTTSFTQRRRVVRSLLKWLVDNQDLCARVACRDTGKTSACIFMKPSTSIDGWLK